MIIFEDVGNSWELQGCLVYKMHLASVILSLSTQTWSESHFINNLNEICSDARIWQRCARTRCDFRRKGPTWRGVSSEKGPWGTVAVLIMVLPCH